MSDDLLSGPVCLLGYLLGSIPFGLLLTRIAGVGDIRGIGSGNIGATNVLRTGRRGLAGATLLLDALKGGIAVPSSGTCFPSGCGSRAERASPPALAC
jgi:glycerol-3-phosphate acyltransferase PlsY